MKFPLPLFLVVFLGPLAPARSDIKQFQALPLNERETFVHARQFLSAPDGKRYDELLFAPEALTPAQIGELDALWQKGTEVALRYEYYKRHTGKSPLDKSRYDGLEKWRLKNAEAVAKLYHALLDSPDTPNTPPNGTPTSADGPATANSAASNSATGNSATSNPANAGTSAPSNTAPAPASPAPLSPEARRNQDALDAAQARINDYLSNSKNAEATARSLALLFAATPGLSPEQDAAEKRDHSLAALLFQSAQNRTLIEQNEQIIAQNEQIIALLKQLAAKK